MCRVALQAQKDKVAEGLEFKDVCKFRDVCIGVFVSLWHAEFAHWHFDLGHLHLHPSSCRSRASGEGQCSLSLSLSCSLFGFFPSSFFT